MDGDTEKRLMDSLTDEQRKGIAAIILNADVKGDYLQDDDGGSVWHESTEETLRVLALYFERYDPESFL